MSEKYSAFSYKAGNSLIHKMPAWGKIIFLPLMSIAIFSLPPVFAIGIFVFQLILSFCLHFTIREQLKDLKPGLYYSILLIIYSLLSSLIAGLSAGSTLSEIKFGIDSASIFMLIKLFCLLQTASILYRTSTSLEIREGCEKIEVDDPPKIAGRYTQTEHSNFLQICYNIIVITFIPDNSLRIIVYVFVVFFV